MEIIRNFYDELEESKFIPITYGIFNKMDDDKYINFLEKKYGEPFSVVDFKYYDFELSEKEKFLLKMHNRQYISNIHNLADKIENYDEMRIYIEYDYGIIRVVKLNKLVL